MKLYLAGSFAYADAKKTYERKAALNRLARTLRTTSLLGQSLEVYNPCELKLDNAWDLSMHEWGKEVFTHDIQAVEQADIVLVASWGKENNSGSIFEAGYATALGKPVILVSMNVDSPESIMLIHSCRAHVLGNNGLKSYINKCNKENKILHYVQPLGIVES